jgi:hypothetical protein
MTTEKLDPVRRIENLITQRKEINAEIANIRAEMQSQLDAQAAALKHLGEMERDIVPKTRNTVKNTLQSKEQFLDWRMIAVMIAIPVLMFALSKWTKATQEMPETPKQTEVKQFVPAFRPTDLPTAPPVSTSGTSIQEIEPARKPHNIDRNTAQRRRFLK